MLPGLAKKRREVVEQRMHRLRELVEISPFNSIEMGDRKRGFITSGVSYLYVKEAFPDASVLKLGICWPLPSEKIREFAALVNELYIVEELDPFLETHVKAMGISCHGKDLIPAIGELNTAIIRGAIDPTSRRQGFAPVELPPRPPNMCAGCPHPRHLLQPAADEGLRLRRYRLLHPGVPAAAVEHGRLRLHGRLGADRPRMAKALGEGAHDKVVSIIGDSTFVHSGITGLINTVYNQSASTLIILDNRITAMTGQQPNPASGATITGEPAHALDIEGLCRAIGVKHVFVVNPHDVPETRKVLKEAVDLSEPSVVISRAPVSCCRR